MTKQQAIAQELITASLRLKKLQMIANPPKLLFRARRLPRKRIVERINAPSKILALALETVWHIAAIKSQPMPNYPSGTSDLDVSGR